MNTHLDFITNAVNDLRTKVLTEIGAYLDGFVPSLIDKENGFGIQLYDHDKEDDKVDFEDAHSTHVQVDDESIYICRVDRVYKQDSVIIGTLYDDVEGETFDLPLFSLNLELVIDTLGRIKTLEKRHNERLEIIEDIGIILDDNICSIEMVGGKKPLVVSSDMLMHFVVDFTSEIVNVETKDLDGAIVGTYQKPLNEIDLPTLKEIKDITLKWESHK